MPTPSMMLTGSARRFSPAAAPATLAGAVGSNRWTANQAFRRRQLAVRPAFLRRSACVSTTSTRAPAGRFCCARSHPPWPWRTLPVLWPMRWLSRSPGARHYIQQDTPEVVVPALRTSLGMSGRIECHVPAKRPLLRAWQRQQLCDMAVKSIERLRRSCLSEIHPPREGQLMTNRVVTVRHASG
jgi:hypothetical protein